jgi:murein tripeptide amidase MpaA
MQISAQFDSGNIEVVEASEASSVQLRIRPDVGGEFMQWYHFRVAGARGQACTFRIINAAAAAYPSAWSGYQSAASYDRKSWFRVPTTYEEGELRIAHTPAHDLVWYAYFAPYSWERHLDLLARCTLSPFARVDRLGLTLDGRDLDRVTVGKGPRPIWMVARQHPGESMAEWWMDGMLKRLLDPDDALARRIREQATVHVVPNMNPDGSIRGHLRTNAAGTNLNRVWHAPTMETEPEVAVVRDAMDASGMVLALDVHGDEELPYNFISGSEGVPGVSDAVLEASRVFGCDYEAANPDFQREKGYGLDAPGEANLSMCSNQLTHRYGVPAMTLEMPFKDTANRPEPVHGWSPARSARLGASVLDPVARFLS